MFLRAFLPVIALLAVTSAHPHHRSFENHRPWRSWASNSSLPAGSLCSSGLAPIAQATSVIGSSASPVTIAAAAVDEPSSAPLLRPTAPSATSAGEICVPFTTTTVVIVYETVTASVVSSDVPSSAPSLGPVSTLLPTTTTTPSPGLAQSSSFASAPSQTAADSSSSSGGSDPSSSAVTTIKHTPPSTISAPIQAETSSTASSSSVGTKRGVIANPIPGVVAPFSQYEKISWDMNWWHGTPPEQPGNWQFLPQLTHIQPDQWWPNADFRHNVSEFPYIVGFLEPDGHVSIDDAVQSWKANLEPLASTHTLIPPMVGQEGVSWLQNFTAACTGCTLDKGPIAFTVYCSPDEGGVADFKNHLSQFKAGFPGRELWAANIGPLGTPSDSDSEWLMRQLVPLLESEPAITRYAWNGDKSFWDSSAGALTPLAQLYATL